LHDPALEVAPTFLFFSWSLPLERFENLVVVLVMCQAQAKVEASTRQDSHQGLNGWLPAARFISGHNGLGHPESIGQLSLRKPRLQSGRENEAAGDGRALEEMVSRHV